MRHSSLVSFLNGTMPAEELWHEIRAEVDECIAGKDRGVGSVIITDGPNLRVTRGHVEVLLKGLATGKLPLRSASYIGDALILSDGFSWEDDAVAEALFFLSDESAPLKIVEVEATHRRLLSAN